MKKSDLRNNMVVETKKQGFYLISGNLLLDLFGYNELEDYTDDLKVNLNPEFDIVRVYDDIQFKYGLDAILEDDRLLRKNSTLIWERQREIDWSKVPKWTKAQYERNGDWINCYHINYDEQSKYWPCEYTARDKFTFETEKYIQCVNEQNYRIHPSVTIPEEWYK